MAARGFKRIEITSFSTHCGAFQYGDEHLISDYSMHEYYRPVENGDSYETPSDMYVWRIRFGESA